MTRRPERCYPLFMRIAVLALALLLCSCGKPWHASAVHGALPDLSFTLQRASDGAAVSQKDYSGRVVLLYFGYTHCPDVCPTTLANVSDALAALGPDRSKVRVLFVSIDPNRDTLDILGPYARSFGHEFEGLRGSDSTVAAIAKRYHIAYVVKTTPRYSVMHTSAVTIFDATGKARLVAGDTSDVAGLADDLKRLIKGE